MGEPWVGWGQPDRPCDHGGVRVRIEGRNLPGRHFCGGEGDPYDNIHVGVQRGNDPVDLVRADAPSADWDLDVGVVTTDDGGLDFRGPAVHGKRGERFLYLTWGNVPPDGSFVMFRRAKLMLGAVDPDLVKSAERSGAVLVATIDLTDATGGPRCARVDEPALVWRAA